jgi:prepilin-type N-terminal cleavage/methylation domain-containing protein
MKTCSRKMGFTLIELLIVVAIIAILAAVAVPNFLEAQTRSKVSRTKADMRTISLGLEAYAADNNKYPLNDGCYNVVPIQISTPVAYLTTTILYDPFVEKEVVTLSCGPPELAKFYTYTQIITRQEQLQLPPGAPSPPVEGIDYVAFNRGALNRYGRWRLVSNGPDRIYSKPGIPTQPWNVNAFVLFGADIPYDPTNGTVSFGNILRTQKLGDGIEP